MPERDGQTIANEAVAHVHAALTKAGVSDREIGTALLSALLVAARTDPDLWIAELYAAGVIVARNAPAGEAN